MEILNDVDHWTNAGMMIESLKHITLVIKAVHSGPFHDNFATVFIAARILGEIVESSSAGGGSHSCPYLSLLSKLATSFAIQS